MTHREIEQNPPTLRPPKPQISIGIFFSWWPIYIIHALAKEALSSLLVRVSTLPQNTSGLVPGREKYELPLTCFCFHLSCSKIGNLPIFHPYFDNRRIPSHLWMMNFFFGRILFAKFFVYRTHRREDVRHTVQVVPSKYVLRKTTSIWP